MQSGHRQPPKKREPKKKGSECVVGSHAGEGGLLEIDGVELTNLRAWMAISVCPMAGESYIIPALAIQHGQTGLLLYEY